MKKFAFFLLATFGIVSLVNAEDNLRRKKVKPQPEKHVYLGTFITLTHVHDKNTTSDVDPVVFTQSFMEAFDVFSKDGYKIDHGFITKSFAVPEDDGDDSTNDPDHTEVVGWNPFRGYSSNMFMSFWDAWCSNCPSFKDDDFWSVTSVHRSLVGNGNAHKMLEAEFCNRLRTSGDPMLLELKHCYIEFTYSAVMEDIVVSAMETEPTPISMLVDDTPLETGKMNCHLDIENVIGSSFSKDDLDIIADIVLKSYNMIHAGLGYEMTNVELVRRLDFPEEPCATGPNDLFNRIWFIEADYECSDKCNRLPPFFALESGLHKAFEDLVCLKLKTSGLPAYHKVSDCEISFVLDDPNEIFETLA
jgi:hypothetical protein